MIIEGLIIKFVLGKVFGAAAAKVAAGVVGKVVIAQTAYEVGSAFNDAANAATAVVSSAPIPDVTDLVAATPDTIVDTTVGPGIIDINPDDPGVLADKNIHGNDPGNNGHGNPGNLNGHGNPNDRGVHGGRPGDVYGPHHG